MTVGKSECSPHDRKSNPVVLAVEGSSRFCSVAIGTVSGNKLSGEFHLLAEVTADLNRTHAERLLPMVEQTLALAGIGEREVTHLAAAVGPGSFTGLRIALAVWKGLAFAWNLPLIGVSTLEAIALQCPARDGIIAPMLDAKMGEIFGSACKISETSGDLEALIPEQAVKPGAFAAKLRELDRTVYALGDGLWRYETIFREQAPRIVCLPAPFGIPRASMVALAAAKRLKSHPDELPDPSRINPVYLRVSQAEAAKIHQGDTAHDRSC